MLLVLIVFSNSYCHVVPWNDEESILDCHDAIMNIFQELDKLEDFGIDRKRLSEEAHVYRKRS